MLATQTRRLLHHRTRRKPEPDAGFAFRQAERDGPDGNTARHFQSLFAQLRPLPRIRPLPHQFVRAVGRTLSFTPSNAILQIRSEECDGHPAISATATTIRSRWNLPTIATPFAPALLGGPWRLLSYDSTTLDQLRRGMTEAGPRHSRPQKIPIDPIIPHRRQLTTHGPEACSPRPEDTGSLLAQPKHPSHTDQNEGRRDITSHTWRGCVDDPSAMLIPSVGFPHLCSLSPITPRPAPVSAHEASEIELSLPAVSVLPLPHPNYFKPTSPPTPSSSFQFLSFLFTKCNIEWSDTVTIFSVESPSAWLLATAQDGVDRAK
ncbi:hypothetical protein CCUS01_01071 [Colletotrichum cuscutae]|uniref:Uncharacterized protein n=1 Tax=Colletotrichum cuscutae TaxID=1209917 RepID=A0AAI9XW75_9PEZI|nr:hypothetical protein CCUS01_01071 [Colletotrichum cuscutae]